MSDLTLYQPTAVIDPSKDLLTLMGKISDQTSANDAFSEYRGRKTENTLRTQDNHLKLFKRFIALAMDDLAAAVDLPAEAIASARKFDNPLDPASWQGITAGLCQRFLKWMLDQGYTVASTNLALSTLRTYAKLAHRAGTLDSDTYTRIRTIEGYGFSEGQEFDEKRRATGQATRIGHKKAEFIALDTEQIKTLLDLKSHPDNAQGRRDRLMLALMLEHSLRCSEVADFTVEGIDLEAGTMRFYRRKTKDWQTDKIRPATLAALYAYQAAGDMPEGGKLLLSTRKGGGLVKEPYTVTRTDKKTGQKKKETVYPGMETRSITARVNELGKKLLKLETLSAHDTRHTWATAAARNNTPLEVLIQSGGWKSPAMPMRYIDKAKIANEGVALGY